MNNKDINRVYKFYKINANDIVREAKEKKDYFYVKDIMDTGTPGENKSIDMSCRRTYFYDI